MAGCSGMETARLAAEARRMPEVAGRALQMPSANAQEEFPHIEKARLPHFPLCPAYKRVGAGRARTCARRFPAEQSPKLNLNLDGWMRIFFPQP